MNASAPNPASLANSAARPRFDPVFDAPVLRIPRGEALGSVLAVVPASDGGLWILHQATIQPHDSASHMASFRRQIRQAGEFRHGVGRARAYTRRQWHLAMAGRSRRAGGRRRR